MTDDLRPFLALVMVVSAGCSCASWDGSRPITPPGVPPSQTIEGATQVVFSPAGLAKLTSSITGSIDTAIDASASCVPRFTRPVALGDVTLCGSSVGGCTLACPASLELKQVSFTPTSATAGTLSLQLGGSWSVPVTSSSPLYSACTLSVVLGTPGGGGGADVSVDVALSIEPSTGRLTPRVVQIGALDLSTAVIGGCPNVVSGEAGFLTDVLDVLASHVLSDVVVPSIDAALAPIANGGTISAEVALYELRFGDINDVPPTYLEWMWTAGGYGAFQSGGLTLGVVTGINYDDDRTTRSPVLISETNPCAIPNPVPDFGAPPYSLPTTARGTFRLDASGAFAGAPMPARDVTVGYSEAMLDLLFHHYYASGSTCVRIDDSLLPRPLLHRDALDDLVGLPLAATDAPLRITTHPTTPFDATIADLGANAAGFHARSNGVRFAIEATEGNTTTELVRVATDVDLGWGLTPTIQADGATGISFVDDGTSTANVSIDSASSRYAGLGPVEQRALARAVASVPYGISAFHFLPSVPLPGVLGFDLEDVVVDRITTTDDDFLAFQATLTSSLTPPSEPVAPTPVPLAVVLDPTTAASVRNALASGVSTGLPTVHITLPATDGGGRPLEHAWFVPGAHFRPYEAATELVVRDAVFAWQGTHAITLRSRVIGDSATESATASVVVVIDFAPPTILASSITFDAAGLHVPARDSVSATATLELAIGPPNATDPTTAWVVGDSLPASTAMAIGPSITVFVRDEAGHVASSAYDLSTGATDAGVDGGASAQTPSSGCGCVVSGAAKPSTSVWASIALVALLARVWRRRARDRYGGDPPSRR